MTKKPNEQSKPASPFVNHQKTKTKPTNKQKKKEKKEKSKQNRLKQKLLNFHQSQAWQCRQQSDYCFSALFFLLLSFNLSQIETNILQISNSKQKLKTHINSQNISQQISNNNQQQQTTNIKQKQTEQRKQTKLFVVF